MSTPQRSATFGTIAQLVPAGHEKELYQAFYNAAAMLFAIAALAAAVYVYFVLEVFLKPLMWALLVGSVLFPLKYSLHSQMKVWMFEQEKKNRLLIIASLMLPLHLFDKFSDGIGHFVTRRRGTFIAFLILFLMTHVIRMLPLPCSFEQVFNLTYQWGLLVWSNMSVMIGVLTQYRLLLFTFFVAYLLIVLLCNPPDTQFLSFFGILAWISIVAFIICISGSFQIPLGILGGLFTISCIISVMQPLIAAGLAELVAYPMAPDNLKDEKVSSANKKDISDRTSESISNENNAAEESMEDVSLRSTSACNLNFLYFACFWIASWTHIQFGFVFTVPLVYWSMKCLLSKECIVNLFDTICRKLFYCDLSSFQTNLFEVYERRKGLLYPPPVNAAFNVISILDQNLKRVIGKRLPALTSVVIILFIILGSMSLILFSVVRIQQESFLMIQLSADVINQTVAKHPEYKLWLPDNQLMLKSVDTVVENVYWQGKDWIKEKFGKSVDNGINSTIIEAQALLLWEHAYNLWLNRSVLEGEQLKRKDKLGDSITGVTDVYSQLSVMEMSQIANFLKDNLAALTSAVESLFSVLKSNIQLLISIIRSVLVALVYGGNAVFNFFVSVIVFFTALFYLLAESNEQYMPLQLIGSTEYKNSFSAAIVSSIQDAVGGVFGASLKMASFYGLYTWTNHAIMGSTLVYIPSLLGAILSVIPIFSTYWCCVPAALELWILQGSLLRSSSLITLQILPTMFVDAAIYREMAASGSGHPYLSGLSVIGGVYYFGLDGAIIGPIVLCLLLVAVNAYFRIMK